MLLLVIAAAATAVPKDAPRGPIAVAEARATVRIVRGEWLRFDGKPNPRTPPPRWARIQTPAGSQRARLIEFE